MPIRRLSPHLVNQIAAGEVIERPASVVKELLENALDAGAERIAVDIEAGGRELIRVADDGGGIPADELALALAPHATSKIAAAADLEAIGSLGFRGEALASIASISRVRLTSRPRDAEAGAALEAAGEQLGEPRPLGCAPGTVVEVRNLFFNTPARRKFMRAPATEMGHISEAVTRIAMAHPDVGLTLRHQQRVSIDLPPHQTAARRCLDLLGPELEDALLEVESTERGIGLWGLVGLPEIARPTARHQYLYVNGRPIRDKHIAHAVREAYRGLIEPTRQPTVVLFLRIDPRQVDVNVHPGKAEVRFADSNAVHGQVLAVIRQRLLGADLTPALDVGGGGGPQRLQFGRGRDEPAAPTEASTLSREAPLNADSAGGSGGDSGGDSGGGTESGPSSPIHTLGDFVDYFRRMDPKQKGFVYQQVRQELGVEESHYPEPPAPADAADPPARDRLTDPLRPSAKPILQVHNSYLVTQDEQGLVIIDQHALHERMMFQALLDRIRSSGRLESQRLLTPVAVELRPAQMALLEQLGPLCEQLGIDLAALGPTTAGVHAFPSLLFDRRVDPAEFLTELIERAEQDDFNPSDEAVLHEVLDMMSCKAAIKAGDALADEELTELLRRREQLERSSNCPHGRPTTVRLTLRELEKHFKRA